MLRHSRSYNKVYTCTVKHKKKSAEDDCMNSWNDLVTWCFHFSILSILFIIRLRHGIQTDVFKNKMNSENKEMLVRDCLGKRSVTRYSTCAQDNFDAIKYFNFDNNLKAKY